MSNNVDEFTVGEEDVASFSTLEHFAELEQVVDMITTIGTVDTPGFEKAYEKYYDVLSRYHEQPHLLDPHLELLLSRLLSIIRTGMGPERHAAFKYLYVVCKVRKYKVFVKFLPHELSDFEFALDLLEQQDPTAKTNWETIYILLLWLSILVLNPFHMSRLDIYGPVQQNSLNTTHLKTKMERIFQLCIIYTDTNSSIAAPAAYLAAKFLVRSDIKEIFLSRYFDWVISKHRMDAAHVHLGQLTAIAAILKQGKREDLLPYMDKLFGWISYCEYKNGTDFSMYKIYIKIVQRIGLVFLKPRVAVWRYKRGTRSLIFNLNQFENVPVCETNELTNAEVSEEFEVPTVIEDVIEELLQALRSCASNIRWNAAKGIGRVTNRLPQCLADQVIGNVLEMLGPLEQHEAWHGACLALAELAKRGLLLPIRLEQVLPLLMKALFYDTLKGYMSVGQNIRDSACYMCWAFARAYQPEDLQPFVHRISAALITVALFDREINCRRAAAAAFQESVGRLGNFPNGIKISTKIDFFTVGTRQKTFSELSDFIAQFKDYRLPLIEHLIGAKVNHWDINIRALAAKALHQLTHHVPDYMAGSTLQKLLEKTNTSDINARHGSVLAIGEIVLALHKLSEYSAITYVYFSEEIKEELNALISKFIMREQFRGICGDLMKACSLDYIKNCSLAKLQATALCLTSWQDVIDKCLIDKVENIRDAAQTAFAEMCTSYYDTEERKEENGKLITNYLDGTRNDNDQRIRMGYIGALGASTRFIVLPYLDDVLNSLVTHSLVDDKSRSGERTSKWSESRSSSVKALNKLVLTVGFDENNQTALFSDSRRLNKVFDTLLEAVNEYTIDDRGDIGAWVREAAMKALFEVATVSPHRLLHPDQVSRIVNSYAQQAVEKIDRTRGIAGRLCCQLVHVNPRIPYIPEHARLREIFPEDPDTVLWLFADHSFPLFCALLEFPMYSRRILLGLSASIGHLSESLVKHSSAALFEFLRSHEPLLPRLCSEIVANFQENALNDRVTHPMLNFLDILLASGTIYSVLHDETNSFAEEIFLLLNDEVKGFKKMYKLASSISVYCQLIQVQRLSKRILSKMAVFLGLHYVHVRKVSATKLYEALALYGDVTDIPEENMDGILTLLSETDFGLPLTEVRVVRNQLCTLMGVKPPVSASTITNNAIKNSN